MSFWQKLCCRSDSSKQEELQTNNDKMLIRYTNKQKYQGQHINQMRNGHGIYTYLNGDQYDGQWLNNKRNGRGKMLYINGDFFMGQWVMDHKQGRGLYVYFDMRKYEGEWRNDKKNGLGKLIQTNGSYYQGQFSDDKKDGNGIYYNIQNKKSYKQIYKAGKLISQLPVSLGPQRPSSNHSIQFDRAKVDSSDLKNYQDNNPEIKQIGLDQLLYFYGLSQIKHLKFLKKHPKTWNLNQVVQWLKAIQMKQFGQRFLKNKISGTTLLELTDEDLKLQFGMVFGQRKRFRRSVNHLRNFYKEKAQKTQKTQKTVLKHLKNYSKISTVKKQYSNGSKNSSKSMNKFFNKIQYQQIVQQNDENQKQDDIPKRKKNQPNSSFIQNFNSENQQQANYHNNYNTCSYNILQHFNKTYTHNYESQNFPPIRSQKRIQNQFQENVSSKDKQQSDAHECQMMALKKQLSKKIKLEQLQNTNIAILRKESSKKKNEEIIQQKKQNNQDVDNREGKNQNQQILEQAFSKESESSDDTDQQQKEQIPQNKRKKSRGQQRIMQMRQLYQYLKDHHISMNFLIPQNQISNLQVIGEGGYGKVYKGKWMSNPVAIKTYLKAGRIHKKSLEDFLKQVEILNNLRHPNVVLYMGMCIQISRYSLITQYLQEGSLFDQLHKKQTKLSAEKIFQIVEDIVLGMVYLHAKDILHRDLKSSNVLIGDDWKGKLCDFGLSEIHSKKKLKVSKARIGTYQWMAPQVLRREKFGFASDVYSFGMILWQLFSEAIPYKDLTLNQIVGLVGYDQTYKVPTPPKGDPFLLGIMENCLQRDPIKRPSFKQILDKLLSHKVQKNNQLARQQQISSQEIN